MKDRLPGEYHQSLDTVTRLPDADDLQKAVYHRVRWFNISFGMSVPAINHNLFLLDYVRQLALPLEVYTMARRLNTISKYDFAYPDLTKPSETTKRHSTTFPECQLMSLVVVATKLLFPFDSDTVKRYPKDPNDPSTLRMNWSTWLEVRGDFDKAVEAARDPNTLKPGSEMHITDNDILDMTDQQLDKYMDWYQTSWIKDSSSMQPTREGGGIDKEILDMFPLHDVPERRKTREQNEELEAEEDDRVNERTKRVQNSLKSRRAISEEDEIEGELDVLRPGACYAKFVKIEDLDRADSVFGDGTAEGKGKGNVVKIFHEEAAEIACLSLKTLLLAVNRTEEKIEQWLIAQRREEVFGNDESDSVGDVEISQDDDRGYEGDEMEVVPETSPPAKLARDLGGLGLGLSPFVEDDDGDVDMEMLPE